MTVIAGGSILSGAGTACVGTGAVGSPGNIEEARFVITSRECVSPFNRWAYTPSW